jgi:hypothetical protein
MSKSNGLTKHSIEHARTANGQRQKWLADHMPERGGGRLILCVHRSGSKNFFFRYYFEKKARTIPIGPYASEPTEGAFTLDQARALARHYSELHRGHETADVRTAVGQDEPPAATGLTVLDLCNKYLKYLRLQGKQQAASDFQRIIKMYLEPSAAARRPANLLTMDEGTDLLGELLERNLKRVPAKLRTILHAAYNMAMHVHKQSRIPREVKEFGIQANPFAGTDTMNDLSEPRTRHLNRLELGYTWNELTCGQEAHKPCMRLARLGLLLGGQRSVQLRRCLRTNVDLVEGTMLLFDPKGRRKKPRLHVLPLTPAAIVEVSWWLDISASLNCKYVFPGTSEDKYIGAGADTHAIARICSKLMAEKHCAVRFHHQDLRRTAETRMAEVGISKDIRAQILSHGTSGIQERHYDMWTYLPQKREALLKWEGYLEQCRLEALRSNANSAVTAKTRKP